jgi:hypothetical protein
MSCNHRVERRFWAKYTNDWTGEEEDEWRIETEHTVKDIGVGAFQCTQCNEVMYYTGLWKKFYTENVSCSGSLHAVQIGDAAKVRAAINNERINESST